MPAASSDARQAGCWGGMDPEDALDFSRAWLADTPPEQLRYLETARWLATRQGQVELLPHEPALHPGYVRLRHGRMRPDAFALHPGQFFHIGADTGYGYAWSPGHRDGAVFPVDVPRSSLLPASLNTPMPHARPGHSPGGLARARRAAGVGALWVIDTTFGEVAALRAAAFDGVVVHPPVPADLIRSRLDADLQRRAVTAAATPDHVDRCPRCGAGPPYHEADCPVRTRAPGAGGARRERTSRAGLGL